MYAADSAAVLAATDGPWDEVRFARTELSAHGAATRWPGLRRNPRFLRAVSIGLVVVTVAYLLVATAVGPTSTGEWLVLLLVLWFGAGLALFAAIRVLRRQERPRLVELRERLRGAEGVHQRALRASVQAWIREQANAATGRSYLTILDYSDSSGLAEIDDPSREVPVVARSRLEALFERMPGGAIGLAGSRGAGKSTLINSLCGGRAAGGSEPAPLQVMVDAPVSYEARDFVLYLFAKVCERVLGPKRAERLREEPLRRPRSFNALALYGMLAMALGVALWIFHNAGSAHFWAVALTSGGYLTLAVWVFGDRMALRRIRPIFLPAIEEGAEAEESLSEFRQSAERRLHQIRFQQTFTSGFSGALKTPIGLEGGASRTAELAERPLTYPEIVALFRDFLEQIATVRKIRIGIDELDKMDAETARRFLNEIKAVFRVPGCFFLISISEDAMSFFERRGLPIRDAFDSTFDDVIHIPNLDYEASRALLNRRIVDLPDPFACLLHVFSSGRSRDLIRAARRLDELGDGIELHQAAYILVNDTLIGKATAARIIARGFSSEGHVALLTAWLSSLAALRGAYNPERLLDFWALRA